MWQFSLALIICGGVATFYGWNEKRLSEGVGTEPAPITMEELEKGVPENPWRKIGEHMEVDNIVYMEKKGTVQYAYFPIVSKATITAAITKVIAQHGDLDKAPQDALTKALHIKVIVKTNRWKTKADIDAFLKKADSLDRKESVGMVTNRVDSLKSDEIKLIKSSFPSFDPDKTVIFEENRTPSSANTALGFMGGGGVVALIGLGMLVARRGS